MAILAYVDDSDCEEQRDAADGIAVVTFERWQKRFHWVPSIVTALEPSARYALVERARAAGSVFTAGTAVDRAVASSVRFGEGTITGDSPLFIASLTTIGRHVVIMTPASIGHDCVIGDFVTIHPSVAISGHVIIEDGVVIGVGAVIVNGSAANPLRVGRGTYVQAGAVVTKSVKAGAIVGGNPARPCALSVHAH